MSTKEGFMRYAEEYLLGSLRDWTHNQRVQQGHVDATYGDDDYEEYLDELRDRFNYSI